MNIGVDIDGVMMDYGGFLRRNGKKYFEKRHIGMKNPDAYFVDEIFDCTMKQGKIFWIKHFFKYCSFEPPFKDCPEVIRRFKDQGHVIHLITCRAFSWEKNIPGWFARTTLKNWLRRNRIPYDEIVFCPETKRAPEKLAACRAHHIDVMIDDDPANILAIKDHVRTVCFDSVWNQSLTKEDTVRAYNWKEVSEIIDSIS